VELLAAYGLSAASLPSLGPELRLTIADDPIRGLHAGLAAILTEPAAIAVRVLPLTDLDARALVAAAAPASADAERLIDVILRATRLVDDQARIQRVELYVGGGDSMARRDPGVVVGAERSTDDDPFVRRLPGLGDAAGASAKC
jgi:hypothetical protein